MFMLSYVVLLHDIDKISKFRLMWEYLCSDVSNHKDHSTQHTHHNNNYHILIQNESEKKKNKYKHNNDKNTNKKCIQWIDGYLKALIEPFE